MKIGAAKRCTSTTDPEVRMAGFGNPNRVFLGMHDDIWVRAMIFQDNGKTVGVVTGDALGFESTRIEEIRGRVKDLTGINVDDILFNASHTHSAPNVMRGQSECIGRYQAAYADWFYDQVVGVIVDAYNNLEDGTLEVGFGECYGVGVNRRRMVTGELEFAPYEAGIRRDEVPVFRAVCNGKVKAIWTKLSCHPSTVGTDYGSADWPGVARRIIEERNPDAVALFTQGCCGNIRVRTVNDDPNPDTASFRGGTWDDIEHFGALLADAAQKVLDGKMEPVTGALSAKKVVFSLPLQPKSDLSVYEARCNQGTYEDITYRYYVEHYDELPEELPYTMQRIDLGDKISVIGMEGEVVVEYEYHMDKLLSDRKVITCGYSNGNPGYICTEEMYKYGGYEPERSTSCYNLREGWKPEAERIILANAERLK